MNRAFARTEFDFHFPKWETWDWKVSPWVFVSGTFLGSFIWQISKRPQPVSYVLRSKLLKRLSLDNF